MDDGDSLVGIKFLTPLISDVGLLKAKNFQKIITEYRIVENLKIKLDEYNIWFTENKVSQLIKRIDTDKIEWYKGSKPVFAPKYKRI